MKKTVEWERIDSGDDHATYRMVVPGGWLYKMLYSRDNDHDGWDWLAQGTVFVPDPEAPRPGFVMAMCGKHLVPTTRVLEYEDRSRRSRTPCPICKEDPS